MQHAPVRQDGVGDSGGRCDESEPRARTPAAEALVPDGHLPDALVATLFNMLQLQLRTTGT
jgi:hypothetical protein